MLKHLSTQEGQIFIFGLFALLAYLASIISTYFISVEDANSLLIITVTNFIFGRAAGISYGLSVDFSEALIIVINIVIELITVMIIYPLFVYSWKRSLKISALHNFFSKVKALRLKYSDFFEKYGKYGLFVFVWFPFWMTGPVVGAIIGFLIGLKHYHTMFIVSFGTSLAIVVWTYFLKEIMLLLTHISEYAPYILLALFIAIAVFFRFIKNEK